MQFELIRAQDVEGNTRSLVVPFAAVDNTLVHISQQEGVELSVQDVCTLSDDNSSNFYSLLEADQNTRICIGISELQRAFTCLYQDALRLSRRRIAEPSFVTTKNLSIPKENPPPLVDDTDAVLGWLQRNDAFRIVNSATRGLRYAGYPRDYYDALTHLLENSISMLVECMRERQEEN